MKCLPSGTLQKLTTRPRNPELVTVVLLNHAVYLNSREEWQAEPWNKRTCLKPTRTGRIGELCSKLRYTGLHTSTLKWLVWTTTTNTFEFRLFDRMTLQPPAHGNPNRQFTVFHFPSFRFLVLVPLLVPTNLGVLEISILECRASTGRISQVHVIKVSRDNSPTSRLKKTRRDKTAIYPRLIGVHILVRSWGRGYEVLWRLAQRKLVTTAFVGLVHRESVSSSSLNHKSASISRFLELSFWLSSWSFT